MEGLIETFAPLVTDEINISGLYEERSTDEITYEMQIKSLSDYGYNLRTLERVDAREPTHGGGPITRIITADRVRTGRIESTTGGTYFDLNQGTIIINDGVNDRILIGYQEGGF